MTSVAAVEPETTAVPVQAVPAADVYAVLASAPAGLSAGQVAARRTTAGFNELPAPGRRLWRRFARQFTDLFAIVLIVASGITFLAYLLQSPREVGTLQLAVAIICVVLLNAVIGFAQRVLGDTTEGALLVVAGKAGVDLAAEEAAAPRVAEFPFDPTRKLMTTVHRAGGHTACYVKGAPGAVLRGCVDVDWDGRSRPLDAGLRAEVVAAGDALAAGGLRVLVVARRVVAGARPSQEEAESGLTLRAGGSHA